MKIIVTATLIEAKTIIDIFVLEKIQDTNFEIYQNSDISLIVSGIGAIKSAIATTYIISIIKKENISNIYNIGIAGCIDKKVQKGEVFLINKIIDKCKNKSMYPDILLTHKLKECSISTFSNVVKKTQTNDINSKLVDMESCGFFVASLEFLKLHKISLIKIVSDYLLDSKNDKFCKQDIINVMGENILKIKDFISNYEFEEKKLLIDIENKYIEQVKLQYSFSFSKQQQIYQAIKYKKLKYKKQLSILDVQEVFEDYL